MSPLHIVFATKALRAFGDGMMSILIARYANALGLSGLEAGLVATAALVGTSVTTFLVGRYTERVGRRRMLLAGAALAIATGAGYAGSTTLAVLTVVAFFGTANPTSGDVSSFLPVEQAIVGSETSGDARVRTFARFNVVGSVAGAFGALASGLASVITGATGLEESGAIRLLFGAYALLGVAAFAITRMLPPGQPGPREVSPRGGLGPSRRRVGTLSALFGVDAFAGGLIVQSIIALYLLREFDMDPAVTGAVFFVLSLGSAVSFLVSARLATRFGLVNTMVFTHLPSNALLVGVAFAPTAAVAVVFLVMRSFLSQMDVPPRQALVVSVVEPGERAAAAAYTGLSRSLASTGGPSAGGALLGTWAGAPFLVCATIKAAYDLSLLTLFGRVKMRS